jgi:hypothetical protein
VKTTGLTELHDRSLLEIVDFPGNAANAAPRTAFP